jgi:hypothetical protein
VWAANNTAEAVAEIFGDDEKKEASLPALVEEVDRFREVSVGIATVGDEFDIENLGMPYDGLLDGVGDGKSVRTRVCLNPSRENRGPLW